MVRINYTSKKGSDPLVKTCRILGLKEPTGPTQHGWSIFSKFLACPKKYEFYTTLQGTQENSADSKSTQLGVAMHIALELYYSQLAPVDPEEFIRVLIEQDSDLGGECERLFEAYTEEYSEEFQYLTPLECEAEYASEELGFTIRIDLLAAITGHDIWPDGVYNIDHKTSGRFDYTLLHKWYTDGQMLLYNSVAMIEDIAGKYKLPYRGSIVNIIGKQKNPKFTRKRVKPFLGTLDDFRRDLGHYRALLSKYQTEGRFPRNRSSCVGPYGLCKYYEKCI